MTSYFTYIHNFFSIPSSNSYELLLSWCVYRSVREYIECLYLTFNAIDTESAELPKKKKSIKNYLSSFFVFLSHSLARSLALYYYFFSVSFTFFFCRYYSSLNWKRYKGTQYESEGTFFGSLSHTQSVSFIPQSQGE